ncbi:Dna2-domain-containing protein, partial [Cryphonectria parasitica EP155]
QRSNTHPVQIPPRQAPPRPSISVSAKTKDKLQQFQFQQSATAETSDLTPLTEEEGKQKPRDDKSVTPVSRLAWQDLMGGLDAETQDNNTSPNEHLEWQNREDEIAAAISPIIRRRGKKRARSSSPVSSPAVEKRRTPTVNTTRLKQALKLPDADPALDLWDRFAVGDPESRNPLGATNPALAHLMVSSSPRPPKEARNTSQSHGESGLRRTMSCGSHWPKRRRIESTSETGMSREQRDTSKSSMITSLLKTVNGEINNSDDLDADDVAMESPCKRRHSPTRQEWCAEAAGSLRSSQAKISAVTTDQAQQMDEEDNDTPTSDYGDDTFDDDALWEIDASLLSEQVQEGRRMAADQPMPTEESRREQETLLDDDEFGDIDDDLLAAAENMLADSKPEPSSRSGISAPTNAAQVDSGTDGSDDIYDDEFGGDFDFEAAELAATQSVDQKASSLLPVSQRRAAIQRYLVTNVLHNVYTDDRGRDAPELVLIVQADRSPGSKTVHLRGDWADTPARPKSFVHIIGDFESSGRCIIDNSRNILILHPDQLISATVVADSFSCMRRAVLQDRVKATSEASAPLVYGTLLHEIFQEALLANKWDQGFLNKVIDQAMKKHIEDLYTIKVSFTDAREHLASKMPEVRAWSERFISSFPKPDALAQGRNNEKTSICVSKLLDIEEHVWSPLYGLKGNIDATIQVTVKDAQKRKTLTVPFEVKTGKNVSENHQAQTMLYNLLLSDRYDIEIMYGILYYMETSLTKIIPAVRNELRHMIKQRNQLAVYIRERSVQLPPMKKSKHMCGKCYAQSSCFVYHKLADDGDGETSGVKDKFDQSVKHLTPTHQEFFLKWEDLLTKEEKESQKLRRELWTMFSGERQKVGRCFANVIIEEGSASEDLHTQKINRFRYTFIKEDSAPGFSFMDSQLGVGEPIVVSDEQGHFALALGFVTAVRKQRISVAVDRRLHNARIRQPGFDEHTNQVYAGIMEVVPEGVRPEQSSGKIKEAPLKFRLDKDEFSNGMALVRNNIVSIMTDSQVGSEKIRRLVVDLKPPEFKAAATQYTISDRDNLNVDQRKAIEKVMSAKDYALVLATPNTFCTGSGQSCWLRDMIDPETRVSFINTDYLPSPREEAKGNRIVNPCEARIVVQLVDALLTVGVPAAEIGVMTHYRSQLSLLKHGLRGHGNGAIEMHTADRFQGRDKEVVILSLVRSNEACNIGDLLKDWRRINVAFTRAKTKLLVVGSKSTLKGSGCEEMLAKFIGLMETRCWIYDMKHDALEAHCFEDAQTQITATGRRGSVDDGIGSPMKGITKAPKKRNQGTRPEGKENVPLSAKRASIKPEVALKGKPNVAGILNDMMGGIF